MSERLVAQCGAPAGLFDLGPVLDEARLPEQRAHVHEFDAWQLGDETVVLLVRNWAYEAETPRQARPGTYSGGYGYRGLGSAPTD